MKNVDIDLQSYSIKRFSDDFTFYWRILKDTQEFEGVAVVNSTSWVGVGWRPSSLTSACRAVPELHERNVKKTSSEPLPRPEPKAEPEGAPEPTAEPEVAPEPEAETKPRNKYNVNNKRSAKHDANVTPQADSDTTVQTSVTYHVSTKQGDNYLAIS